MSRVFGLWIGVWSVVVPLCAVAQDDWVGQEVFYKEDVTAKVGNRIVDIDTVSFPATVDKVNGEWLWLGRAWVRKQDVNTVDQALAYYSDLIRREPREAAWWGNRGMVWKAKEEYDNAIKDFAEAIRLDPNPAWIYNNRGLAWQAKEEFDIAIKDFSECIRLDPKYTFAYHNRGRAKCEKKDYESAIIDFTDAIRLDPLDSDNYYERANASYGAKQYEKAIRDCKEAIRLNPAHPGAYNDLAWMRATCQEQRFRNGDEATDMAKKACELAGWKNAKEIDTLAAAYAESGNFAKALYWQDKAIDLQVERSFDADYRSRLELYKSGKPYRAGEDQ